MKQIHAPHSHGLRHLGHFPLPPLYAASAAHPSGKDLRCMSFGTCSENRICDKRGEMHACKRFKSALAGAFRHFRQHLSGDAPSLWKPFTCMQDSRHKQLKMGFLRACAPSRFSAFFLLNPLTCLKKPYISGIFRFEIRHVRYMPIDVGTAHNHTAAVGKPSILIALISDIPNPAPPPAILMSDVRNVSSRCAYCCHLRRNRTGISCRTPCHSHAPNI